MAMARRNWTTDVEITLTPLGKRAKTLCVLSPPPKRAGAAPASMPPPPAPPEFAEQKNARLERELASARAHSARLEGMIKDERRKREKVEQQLLRWQLQTQRAASSDRSGWKAYYDIKRKYNLE